MLLLQPGAELLKGQHRVDLVVVADVGGLVLLRNAGACKYDARPGAVALLEQAAVRDHRGNDRRHLVHQGRIVQFNQTVDGRAAGRNDVLHAVLLHDAVVLRRHIRRALRGLRNAIEAERLHRARKLMDVFEIKASIVRRGNRKDDPLAALNHLLNQGDIARHRLSVLRALLQAGAAEDAVAVDDFRLFIFYLDGFDRANLHTFIAVFAICFLQANNTHLSSPILHT